MMTQLSLNTIIAKGPKNRIISPIIILLKILGCLRALCVATTHVDFHKKNIQTFNIPLKQPCHIQNLEKTNSETIQVFIQGPEL